jgi:hypothetical protein
MPSPSRGVILLASAAVTLFGCSSGSGGGGSGAASGNPSGVLFACTAAGIVCVDILAPESAMAAEQAACAMQSHTFSTGVCSSEGVEAICEHGVESDYYYTEASLFQGDCATEHGTWIVPDGGSTGADAGGPAAFVGTWARSGTQTTTCGTSAPTMSTLSGDLVITLGMTAGTVAATQPDGCVTDYAVSGNVATAAAGQVCNETTEAGVAETVTVTSHTFVLSADGMSLMSTGSSTIDKTATGAMCTLSSSGTFTKTM